MYNDVDTTKLKDKFNGIISNEDLLKEYQNDDEYELTEDLMESKANVESTNIGFKNNKNGSIYND